MDNLIVELEHDELMHYGVKGMKWGVRRKRYLSKIRTKGRKMKRDMTKKRQARKAERSASKAAKKASENTKRKSVSEMTDEELNSAIKRMQLERQYKELYASSHPKQDKGKKFVSNVLEKSGEQLATQVVNHYGAKALNAAIGEEVIFANNKKK